MSEDAAKRFIASVATRLAGELESAAKASGLTPPVMLDAVVKETKRVLGDGRNMAWRVRVRLYSATDNYAEPVADSDPELPIDQPGSEVVKGLAAVADYLAQLANEFHHGGPCKGLDAATLEHRLKSLRPTLSRRGGNAAWRVPYQTWETIGERGMEREWLGRVDVEKVE